MRSHIAILTCLLAAPAAASAQIGTGILEKYKAALERQTTDPDQKREGGTQPRDWDYQLPEGVRTRQVTFYVDGTQTHHAVQATLKDAAKLHMNAWPTDNSVTQFAGPFNPAAVPCEAQYDWIEAYSYTP